MGLRLFAALVPPPEVLDHAAFALDQVRHGPVELMRWVPRENLHLTLAFYGDVPIGALPEVAEALALVAGAWSPSELQLSGAGSFGGRTLWLGISNGHDGALAGLMRQAADVLEQPRGGTDGPPRPHVTVARTGRRSRGVDLAGVVQALSVYRGPRWRPHEVVLMSSWLGEGRSSAPRYEVVAVAPVADAAEGPPA